MTERSSSVLKLQARCSRGGESRRERDAAHAGCVPFLCTRIIGPYNGGDGMQAETPVVLRSTYWEEPTELSTLLTADELDRARRSAARRVHGLQIWHLGARVFEAECADILGMENIRVTPPPTSPTTDQLPRKVLNMTVHSATISPRDVPIGWRRKDRSRENRRVA